MEVSIPIGNPPKKHKFDCVSDGGEIVAECKCYTWTEAGNIPSAKFMGINEALFYMSYLPDEITKILCIKKSSHIKKVETLAEYYTRINRHLLGNVKVFEIDEFGTIKEMKIL